mgnify:CR=1 FL=1
MTALKDDCLRQRDEIIALPLGTALCAAYAAARRDISFFRAFLAANHSAFPFISQNVHL